MIVFCAHEYTWIIPYNIVKYKSVTKDIKEVSKSYQQKNEGVLDTLLYSFVPLDGVVS